MTMTVAQTYTNAPASLDTPLTWNASGGSEEISVSRFFTISAAGITVNEACMVGTTVSAQYRLSGTRAQGTIYIMLNGVRFGPANLNGTSTYHRQSGGATQLVSELSNIAMRVAPGDVVNCAVGRVPGSSIGSSLTLIAARMTLIRIK